MSTIANLPAADVSVEFPDGVVREVNMIVLLCETQTAECKAKFGHHLAPNAPTLAKLRDKYGIPAFVRTWEQMAVILRDFHDQLSAAF